jgi:hypothetical protein
MFTDKQWLKPRTMQLEVNTDLGWLAIEVEYSRTDEADEYDIAIESVSYGKLDITDLFDHEVLADRVASYEYDER